MIFEYGIMSSKYSIEVENKLTAYAAMIMHLGPASTAFIAIYSPEESRKHWIPLNSLYNEIDRRMNMKEAILKLENNKTISTKDIKCPVCGGLMEIEHSEVNSHDCSSSISLEHMPAPFEGTMVKRRNVYTTRFKCPNECCHLEMKHYIENIFF